MQTGRRRVLVIGGGVIGTVYGGQLAAAGHDVSLLVRGIRLDELSRAGLRLQRSGGLVANPEVEVLDAMPQDVFDLLIVAVRREQASAAVQEAASVRADTVLLFGNFAGMTSELAATIGPDRVIAGFPGVGGRLDADVVVYVMIRQQQTVVGPLDTAGVERAQAIASLLRGAGFPVVLKSDVDGWLSSHAALVVPMAAAIRAAGGQASVLADRGDLLRLAVRATRAVYRDQRNRRRLVANFNLRLLYLQMPVWFAVSYWSRELRGQFGELAFAAHTRHAWNEMAALGSWLRSTLAPDGAAVQALDRLMDLATD